MSFANAGGHLLDYTTLDAEVSKHQELRAVGFVKISANGRALQVLQGAEALLRAQMPVLEVQVFSDAEEMEDVRKFVDDLGVGYDFEYRYGSFNR